MAHADAKTDAVYDQLRDEFGDASPKASGYLSERSFIRERGFVLEAVGDAPGTVLDVACGGGLVSAPLVAAGRRVIGMDFNAGACRCANSNGIEALRGNAFELPLAANVADLVLNVEFVQEHEPEMVERMLREVARVLRPGGRLVMVWGNRDSLAHRIVGPLSRAWEALRGRKQFARLTHHTVADMRAAGERTGLAVEDVFAIFPPCGLRLARAEGALATLLGTSFVATFRATRAP